jgi:hypothetical protein
MAEPPKKRVKPSAATAAKKPAQSSSSYFDDLMRDVSSTHSAMQAVSTSAGNNAGGGQQARSTAAAVPAGENRAAAIAKGLLAARGAALALGLDPQTAESELEVNERKSLVQSRPAIGYDFRRHISFNHGVPFRSHRWRHVWALCIKKTWRSASFLQLLATTAPWMRRCGHFVRLHP